MMVNHYCLSDGVIVALHSKQTTFIMTKLFTTSFCLLSLAFHLQAQTPITLQASDVPIPTAPFNILSLPTTGLPATSIGSNQSWNYSSFVGNNPSQNVYEAETDPFFTAAGIDVFLDGTKSFNTSFIYNIANEWDFNNNGVDDKGYYVYAQDYSLSSITGNNADSLFIPEQKYILNTPRKILAYPCTFQSAWSSDSRRVTQFKLNVAGYGLNQAPAEHAYHMIRKDSIVSWGKLKLYTTSGPSAEVDVLVDKVASYAIDSFYLNGSPAPAALLTAFGVAQGQQTNTLYYYNFMRKNAINYLMRIAYGTDASYSTITGAYVNTDNLAPTSIQENEKTLYSSSLFPNPATTPQLHILLSGQAPEFNSYSIYNFAGQCVQQGNIIPSPQLDFTLDASLSNGLYTITINNKQQVVTQHSFTIQR